MVLDGYSVQTVLGVIRSKQALTAMVGEQKLLAIRPQQLRLSVVEQGIASITQQQFLGMTTHCTITLTDSGLELSVSMQQPMVIDDVVSVTIESHDLVLFDRD